jgi:glycosyltransferase involved in cell wall biosynthesis
MELARRESLEQQISIIGAIPYADLPAAYHHATVNLFASSCENCPNILLEALGAGRPVLSSNVMPMPEFGADAVGYFSPTDSNSIRDELFRVLSDESRRTELAAAAARRSEDFDWAITSRKTWAHIFGLVGR